MKPKWFHIIFVVCTLLAMAGSANAQSTDSVQVPDPRKQRLSDAMPTPKADTLSLVVKRHSPKKAALFSAVLPGLGQGYNKKYWKIPIIYAGLATSIYFVVHNRNEYNRYKEAFILETDGDSTTVSEFNSPFLNTSALRSQAEDFQTLMEISYIATGIIYILNIVDATVDAHFYDYDLNINDDLSLGIRPSFPSLYSPDGRPNQAFGLSLNLRFR